MKLNLYFQSSLPRSGSTLMQNIIGQRDDFYVTPTSGLIDLVGASRQVYVNNPNFKAQDQEQMRRAFLSFSMAGMKGYFKGLTDKSYVVDKSRGWMINYDFLSSMMKDPKIIVMIRDLRDVYTSMEKNFNKNQDKAMAQIDLNSNKMITVQSRIDEWSKTTPVGTSIEQLFACVQNGNIERMHVVRYEDLCKNPQEEMDKVYKYLGVDSYKHDFDNIEQVTHENDVIHGIYGDHKIHNKLNFVSSQSEDILGKELSDNLFKNYEWFYNYFGYGN